MKLDYSLLLLNYTTTFTGLGDECVKSDLTSREFAKLNPSMMCSGTIDQVCIARGSQLTDWTIFNRHTAGNLLSIRNTDNIIADDTGLHLLTKYNTDPVTSTSKRWTTGSMMSKKTFGYGYYESSFIYCGASGINNAFWLTTDGGSGHEIDINEGKFDGRDSSRVVANLHKWTVPQLHRHIFTRRLKSDLSRVYTAYGVLYTPTFIEWYINGDSVYRYYISSITPRLYVRYSTAVGEWAGHIYNGIQNNTSIAGTRMTVKNFKYYSLR